MTTSDWAFVISLCSLTAALGSFVWNVWSKFIYPKAHVRVSFQATIIFHPGNRDHEQEFLTLTATNHGPGDVTLQSATAFYRKAGWWKNWRAYFNKHYKRQYGLLNPLQDFPNRFDYTIGPFSGGLPKKLPVGEAFSSYFPRKVDWLQHKRFRIGFNDSFGRNHWCSKRDVEEVRAAIAKKETAAHN